MRPVDELFFKFGLEIVLGFLPNLESTVDFWDWVWLFPCELYFLDRSNKYDSFSIELFSVKFSFCLHGWVDVPVDDKGLASHPDIFFGDDLWLGKNYINYFPILFEDVVKGVFEFVNRYFFIQVIDINCIVRTGLPAFVLYRLVCITYLTHRSSLQTFSFFNYSLLYYKSIFYSYKQNIYTFYLIWPMKKKFFIWIHSLFDWWLIYDQIDLNLSVFFNVTCFYLCYLESSDFL